MVVRALVNPRLLYWARDTAGYDLEEVARKLRVNPSKLAEWEQGTSAPTVRQARRLATLYKRPVAVFYLPEPPPADQFPPDYRRFPGSPGKLSPRLRYELRRARFRREVALELLHESSTAVEPFPLHVDMEEHASDAAARIRDILQVSFARQLEWHDSHVALKEWRDAVESAGVLVFQTESSRWGVSPDEMRGSSIYESVLPVIVVNGMDTSTAKIFSLIHELAHLALRTSGICDWEDSERIEVFCNAVAADVLMPRKDLAGLILSDPLVQTEKWSDEAIQHLAQRLKVSREALVRQLLTMGEVSQSFYQMKRKQYGDEFLAWREQERIKRKQKDAGGPQPHVMALRDNGARFTRLVLDAARYGDITVTEACRYLGINQRHFDSLETAAWTA